VLVQHEYDHLQGLLYVDHTHSCVGSLTFSSPFYFFSLVFFLFFFFFFMRVQHEYDHLQGLLYVDRLIPRSFRTTDNLRMPLPATCPKLGES